MVYQTNISGFCLINANEEHSDTILFFIRELAAYEHFESSLTVTSEKLKTSLFINKEASCLLACYLDVPVGFLIFYENYSILTGQANAHIEALYVTEEFRNRGFGSEIMRCMANIALKRNYNRIDWACLKWNIKAIDFYKRIGAFALDDRDTYRLEGSAIKDFALGILSE